MAPAPIEPLRAAFRAEAAKGEMTTDFEVYTQYDLNPTEPVLLGSGDLKARIGLFGRDPGRTEIELREPFIGKGGQHIRNGLHRALHGSDCVNLAASIEAGRDIFWGNTVPYKPLGNKAWSVKVKRRFAPIVQELLVNHWQGNQLLTCGRVAFFWFGLADKSLKPKLEAFWKREDRFRSCTEINLGGKSIWLHPLPHPSPLNAVWYKRFPGLLDARLKALGWPDSDR
jgi:uracil-DNA glycosylase